MLITHPRGARTVGINGDEPGAPPLGLLHQGPDVQPGIQGIGGPEEDQLALDQSLGRKAEKHIRVGERAIQPTSTDGPCQGRGAQGVKETAVDGVTLIDAVVAAVGVGQDRLRPVRCYRLLHLCRHRGDCLVPGEALEARSWSLWAHALDRIKEAVWCVHPVKELVDLGA